MNQNSSLNSKTLRAKSPCLPLQREYLRSLCSLNDRVIGQAVREGQLGSAQALLGQLQASIRGGNYGTYSANKKHYYYHMFVCQHNTALLHQQRSDNPAARAALDRAINSYERIQGYITSREENVGFLRELALLQLQFCGLLSHCDQHQQAAALAEKSLDRIVESSRILQAICYEQALLNAQRETTCSSRERGGRNEMVDFRSQVLQEAEEMLQELAQLPPCHRLTTEQRQHFQKIIGRISAWQENEGNNEAALRRELKVGVEKGGRNILGLQKQAPQNEYEIGSLMVLTFREITYNPQSEPLRLLSSHSLRQAAFCAAVAYFTIATETRFSEADLSDIRGSMRIDEKYRKLNHDERLLKCKILHIKALQIAGKLLPSNNCLFGHLCQSFSRNYKFVLDEINEVTEVNSMNTIKVEEREGQGESSIETEYGIKVKARKGREGREREKSVPRRQRKTTSKKKQRAPSLAKK